MGLIHAMLGGHHHRHGHHHLHHAGHHHGHHGHHRHHGNRAHRLATLLDFDAEQTRKLDALQTQLLKLRTDMLTDQAMQAVVSLLDSPTVDRAAAQQQLATHMADAKQAMPAIVDALADLLDALSTQQKHVLSFLLHKLARQHQADHPQQTDDQTKPTDTEPQA